MNQYPQAATRPRVPRWAVGGIAAAALLAGCGSETAGPSSTTSARSAPNIAPSKAQKPSGEAKASPSKSTTAGTLGKTVVCDAIFTIKTGNDAFQVIGRPVVGPDKQPMHTEVNQMGGNVEPLVPQEGTVTWYSLAGKELATDDVPCKEAPLFPKRIESPAVPDNIKWQFTTDAQGKQPEHWDLNALKPADFAGVGLNYTNEENPMTQFDLGEVLNQAAHDVKNHPIYNN